MKIKNKLLLIKITHTIIWVFFVGIIFFVLYSAIVNRITRYTWIACGLVMAEGLVLALFKSRCPLTILARKYSTSDKDNFDIYLPEWLAHYNKIIFTAIYLFGLLLLGYRFI